MASKDVQHRTKQLSRSDSCDSDHHEDPIIVQISCWNIMGSSARGFAAYRKAVTTATFEHKFRHHILGTKTSLGEADIICLQEMTFNPASTREGAAVKYYLPFIDEYEVESCQENGDSGKYNAVFFKNFEITETDLISRAFRLMKIKCEVYKRISSGGDKKKREADDGDCQPWGTDKDEKDMCKEVLEECKQQGFEDGYKRFIGPQDREPSRTPEELLKHRMAICCLKHQDIRKYRLVVVSVHNYHRETAAENYAHLLFDFLAKVEAPVLIAGDFNLNIKKEASLKKFLCDYSTVPYEINPP